TYTFANEAWLAGTEGNEKWRQRARAALTAAVPHIAAQATADLRAGIEALRDEWRAVADRLAVLATMHSNPDTYTARITMLISHADALDALLKEVTTGA